MSQSKIAKQLGIGGYSPSQAAVIAKQIELKGAKRNGTVGTESADATATK